tara:strand:- start:168 stop:743 length:576 start_codon:yes stop_codon:yes gene_type:complete
MIADIKEGLNKLKELGINDWAFSDQRIPLSPIDYSEKIASSLLEGGRPFSEQLAGLFLVSCSPRRLRNVHDSKNKICIYPEDVEDDIGTQAVEDLLRYTDYTDNFRNRYNSIKGSLLTDEEKERLYWLVLSDLTAVEENMVPAMEAFSLREVLKVRLGLLESFDYRDADMYKQQFYQPDGILKNISIVAKD